MSMIYECPNCHMPQAAGRVACRHCRAEFDRAVPDDAFLPNGTAPEPPLPEPVPAAAREVGPAEPPLKAERTGAAVYQMPVAEEAEPVAAAAAPVVQEDIGQEAMAEETEPLLSQSGPPLEAIPPPPAPAETLPYQSSPYPTTAYQPAPTPAKQVEAPERQPRPPAQALTRVLLIAFPIVIVFVLGAVFFARSLDSGQDTAPTAPPHVLNGARKSTGGDADPRIRRMVGRWESKAHDFYVFNANKTGAHGSLTGKGPQGAFLWTLAQNRLILDADKQEKLTYRRGPDEDTISLRVAGGKYVQYTRTRP